VNEALLYGGITLAIVLFILSVVLFFTQNIIDVMKYYMKIKGKKIISAGYVPTATSKPSSNSIQEKQSKPLPEKNPENLAALYDPDMTQLLERGQDTELLRGAQEYATALLEAEDSTQILPRI